MSGWARRPSILRGVLLPVVDPHGPVGHRLPGREVWAAGLRSKVRVGGAWQVLPWKAVCRMAGGTPRIAGPPGGGRGGCAGKEWGPEDASPEASAPREPGMTWPGAVSRGISGCRLRGGPGGGVGLAAEKGQGGGEVGAAAGSRGVGAAAAAGGQA